MKRLIGFLAWMSGCGFDSAIDGPPAGNPAGHCAVPVDAQLEDSSRPDQIVGAGTPKSCTAEALAAAVANGGVVTFDCGAEPVTITLSQTLQITSRTPKVILDGSGKIALSGGGTIPIFTMKVCDPMQAASQTNCQPSVPLLAIQNLTLVDGNTSGRFPDGGGAIFVSGGRLKVVNSRFFRNRSDYSSAGGGVIRATNQYGLPVYVVNSTFGGAEDLGNFSIAGGALSMHDAPCSILNSLFSHNQANAANGAGAGGAIFSDWHNFDEKALNLCGVQITDNRASGPGGALFFSGYDTSVLSIESSVLRANQNRTETPGYPGIVVRGKVTVQSSTFE